MRYRLHTFIQGITHVEAKKLAEKINSAVRFAAVTLYEGEYLIEVKDAYWIEEKNPHKWPNGFVTMFVPAKDMFRVFNKYYNCKTKQINNCCWLIFEIDLYGYSDDDAIPVTDYDCNFSYIPKGVKVKNLRSCFSSAFNELGGVIPLEWEETENGLVPIKNSKKDCLEMIASTFRYISKKEG